VSLSIIYVLELVGHQPLSLILIITFVDHSLGVNEKDKPLALSVQLAHPLIEYATAVLGDGHEVSFMLHVIGQT
jgi:hypothetical protein